MWAPPIAALSALLLLHTAAYSMVLGLSWPNSIDSLSGTTENNEDFEEKVIARRKRKADPFGIFSEIRDAIKWVNQPFTAEQIQELNKLAANLESGQTPTEVGIRRTCQGFSGECHVTQTARYNIGRERRDVQIKDFFGGILTHSNSNQKLLNNSVDMGVEMEEKHVGTKESDSEPYDIVSEVHNAIEWLNAPFTEEEERLIKQIYSGYTPTQEDLKQLCQGFEGDCMITETTLYSVQYKNRLIQVQTNSESEKIQEKSNLTTSNNGLEKGSPAGQNNLSKPIAPFTETEKAIHWLLRVLTEDEEQLLTRLSSDSTARGDTRTKRGSGKQRDKRFIKEFISSLFHPNGRLEGTGREIVNADNAWTPKIPAVHSPQSEREQQNLYGASQSSYNINNEQYFNEYLDSSSQPKNFNEYNKKMNGQDREFDENRVSNNAYFNEYSSSNGRQHQRWYDF